MNILINTEIDFDDDGNYLNNRTDVYKNKSFDYLSREAARWFVSYQDYVKEEAEDTPTSFRITYKYWDRNQHSITITEELDGKESNLNFPADALDGMYYLRIEIKLNGKNQLIATEKIYSA